MDPSVGSSLNLVQSGNGITALSGANSYILATTVSAGTLLINGVPTGASAFTANGGTLGGTGTLPNAAHTIATGGTLDPGAVCAIGQLKTRNLWLVSDGLHTHHIAKECDHFFKLGGSQS